MKRTNRSRIRGRSSDYGRVRAHRSPGKKIIPILIVVLGIMAAAGVFFRENVLALFSPKKALTLSEYSGSREIENSVLCVGTWLINLNGMTDELYEKAVASGSEAGQTNVYYKSELAGGSWFDITGATGLADIKDSGQAVSFDEIGGLYVKYYADKSGIVTDLKTGEVINPFDIPSAYDLKEIPELQPLWAHFTQDINGEEITEEDYLKKKNSKRGGTLRSDVYTWQLMSTFFSLNLKDSTTDAYDADLARLYAGYKTLRQDGKDEEAETLYALMAATDAARRAVILDKLSGGENNLLSVLYELANGKYYTSFGDFLNPDTAEDDSADSDKEPSYITELRNSFEHEFSAGEAAGDDWWGPLQNGFDVFGLMAAETQADFDEDSVSSDSVPRPGFSPDAELIEDIKSAMTETRNSYGTCRTKALSDSDSVLGHAYYEYARRVIEEASSAGVSGPVNYLRDLINIKEGIVRHAQSEINLLDTSLLGLAEAKFEAALTSSPPAEYGQAISRGEGVSSADAVLDQMYAGTEARRLELEYLIEAYREREAAAKVLTYVEGSITWTNELYDKLSDGAFSGKATGALDNHIKWLKDLAKQIKASDASLRSELDMLSDQKKDLQKLRDQALDQGNLGDVKEYDAAIKAIDDRIAAEETRTGRGVGDQLADDILTDALAKLSDDPEADISGALGSLSGMGAVSALETIKDRAEKNNASKAQTDAIAAALSAAKGNAGNGFLSNGLKKDLSPVLAMTREEILSVLEDEFDAPVKSLSDEELAVAAAAVSRFARNGNIDSNGLLKELTDQMKSSNNIYLYDQYTEKTPRYVSLPAIGRVTGFRYLYDDKKNQAGLNKGASSFAFTTGSDIVIRNASDEQTLHYPAVKVKDLYISADDAYELFFLHAEYLAGSDLALCLTEAMDEKAAKLLKELTGENEE